MDMVMKDVIAVDTLNKITTIANKFRISNIEDMLSDCLENLPENSCIDYIGELNKNDVMH